MGSKSLTGQAVARHLASNSMTQAELATRLCQSKPYVNQVLNGVKPPNPRWLDLVASVMELTETQKTELHRAAAKDHGFKIDLPPLKKLT